MDTIEDVMIDVSYCFMMFLLPISWDLRILAKLKTIRDLAPHERPGRIDAANLQVEEVEDLLGDERAIQDLAREILPLLPTVPAIEEEEEDCGHFAFVLSSGQSWTMLNDFQRGPYTT